MSQFNQSETTVTTNPLLFGMTLKSVQEKINSLVVSGDKDEDHYIQVQSQLMDVLELVKTNQSLPENNKITAFENIIKITEVLKNRDMLGLELEEEISALIAAVEKFESAEILSQIQALVRVLEIGVQQ